MGSLHLLLEEGHLSSLTNDQIGQLNDHDGDEETRVTGVLKGFALFKRLNGEHVKMIPVIPEF